MKPADQPKQGSLGARFFVGFSVMYAIREPCPCSLVTSRWCQITNPLAWPALRYSAYSNWSLATYPFFSSSKLYPKTVSKCNTQQMPVVIGRWRHLKVYCFSKMTFPSKTINETWWEIAPDKKTTNVNIYDKINTKTNNVSSGNNKNKNTNNIMIMTAITRTLETSTPMPRTFCKTTIQYLIRDLYLGFTW